MSRLFIDQKQNFRSDFGEVLRSSSIFWVKKSANFKSTISFLNYWKIKRDLETSIFASVRQMDGTLVRRERLKFNEGHVINFSHFSDGDFEGSVEIEVFSLENMVIPYAAIMAVYESSVGVSMVHGYTRTYSRYEVEDKKTITNGEEGCWLINDSSDVRSFAIVHNGAKQLGEQNWTLTVTNHNGKVIEAPIHLSSLNPFETIKIIPSHHFPDLSKFLENKPATATLSFELGESFTRMLVGNETLDGKDFQVTHSNFNYSKHQTDFLDGVNSGQMYMPQIHGVQMNAIVYPDAEPGSYSISKETGNLTFTSGSLLQWPLTSERTVKFAKQSGGGFPSRIVTALQGHLSKSQTLPFECSLGVASSKRPPKRLWWGIVALGHNLKSRLIAIPMLEIYGEIDPKTKISVSIYGSKSHQISEMALSYSDMQQVNHGIYVDDLFPFLKSTDHNDFGYFTFYSDYPGFGVYSTIENKCGSFTIEHGF